MCTLIQYLGSMGTFLNPSLLLSWMFEHDCLDRLFGHMLFWVSYMHVLYFCICICSAQLSMFHMERHSRNNSHYYKD